MSAAEGLDPDYLLHNLRNYVGTVLGNAERLKADPADERALHLIRKAAELALRDIDGFTDICRRPELKHRAVELTAWLRDTVERHEVSRTPGVRVVLQADGPRATLEADPELLAEATGMILTNSIEAMPTGGVLTIRVRPGKGACRIAFEDSGPPVSPQTMEMIGAPFFTLKPKRIGLGLSRARQILAGHGGRLELTRSPEGSLKVEFILPLAAKATA